MDLIDRYPRGEVVTPESEQRDVLKGMVFKDVFGGTGSLFFINQAAKKRLLINRAVFEENFPEDFPVIDTGAGLLEIFPDGQEITGRETEIACPKGLQRAFFELSASKVAVGEKLATKIMLQAVPLVSMVVVRV